MKKLSVTAITAIMLLSTAQAQIRITGHTVSADGGKDVGYVTVAAMRDSVCAAANCADGNGRFSLTVDSAATYRMQFSMLGYRTRTIEVNVESATDMGDIAMEEGEQLDGVEIVVQKPLVTHTAEKLTYEVENDPQSATSTLEQILRKVPQLSIDTEGKVLINGESNYKILVNGHASGSMSRNFTDVIKSMPASSIKRIEVITNPGIKYDAEGTAGILNISTSTSRVDGFDGSVNARGQACHSYYGNLSARAALQTGKFAVEMSAYGGYYNSPRGVQRSWSQTENLVSDINRYRTSSTNGTYDGRNFGATLSASYQITEKDLITLEGGIYASPGNKSRQQTDNTISDAQLNPVSRYTDYQYNNYRYLGGSATLAYEHRFDEDGKHTFSLADNIDIDPDWWTVENEYQGDLAYRQIENEDTRSIENTFQTDYSRPIGEQHHIDIGAKHIYRRSSIMAASHIDDAAVSNSTMHYTQHVAAMYAGYNYDGDKWNVNGGARVEATYNAADVDSSEEGIYSFDNSFWNVIPYLSLGWQPAAGHNLSLTYTERLGRPSIEELSPYQRVTASSVTSGNPDLHALTAHSLTLKYAYSHNKWNLSVYPMAQLSNNAIEYYASMHEDGLLHSMPVNDARARRYSLAATLMFRPNDKFTLSFTARATYSHYWLPTHEIDNDGVGIFESLNMDIKLWKGATLNIYQMCNRQGAYFNATNKDWTWYYGLGLTQKLVDDKLTLSIATDNPFISTNTQHSERTETYITSRGYSWRATNISFGISWRFGKRKADVKSINKTIDNDDSVSSGGSK